MIILNLVCGTQTSPRPEVVNIDWSMSFRIKKNPVLRLLSFFVLSKERKAKLAIIPQNILCTNLAKGIPFATNSIDAVYHNHLLEHFDRNVARNFLFEIKRVLKPGGIHRMVIPDFEKAVRAYISHISICDKKPECAKDHDQHIENILEQSVRKASYGRSQQKPFVAFIEKIILGDARERGETHQWMYDRISIKTLLQNIGYKNITFTDYKSSIIANWTEIGLDVDKNGMEFRPGSLHIESTT